MEFIKIKNVEKRINLLFFSIFFFNLFLSTFNNLFRQTIGNVFSLDTVFVHSIYILLIIPVIIVVVKRLNSNSVLLLISLLFYLVISLLMNDSDAEITTKILLTFISLCVPAYAFSRAVRDFETILNGMWKLAWCVLTLLLINVFVTGIMGVVSSDHNLAYYSLFCAAVFFTHLFKMTNVAMSIVGLLISMILMVMSNTAGALFSLGVCIILLLVNYILSKRSITKIAVVLLLIVFICVLIVNADNIISWVVTTLDRKGINSYVINEIWSGSTTSDRYRESIYQYAWDYSKKHILFGSGIGYDRALISNNTLVSAQSKFGNYPHNLFLEFMMQYGMLPGLFISLSNIIYIANGFIKEKENDQRLIFIILFTIGIAPLMVSATYIEHSYYFALLGYISARNRWRFVQGHCDDQFI